MVEQLVLKRMLQGEPPSVLESPIKCVRQSCTQARPEGQFSEGVLCSSQTLLSPSGWCTAQFPLMGTELDTEPIP